MADQKEIILRQGDATPKDIILRDLPVATPVQTIVYLFQGDVTAKDIVLRNPLESPAAPTGNDVFGSITESSDTLSGAVDLELELSGAITEGSDAVSGTVEWVAASAVDVSGAITESTDTVAGTADLEIEVSGSVNESSDQAAGTADLEIELSGAFVEGSDSCEGVISGGEESVIHAGPRKRNKRKLTFEEKERQRINQVAREAQAAPVIEDQQPDEPIPDIVIHAAKQAINKALKESAEQDQRETAEYEFKAFIDVLNLQLRVEYVNELWDEYEKARLDDEMAAMALLLFEQ